MTHFPVSNSNLSATHLGIFLAEQYLLPSETICRILRAGVNDTYFLDDGNTKYVFRLYSLHWRTEKDIAEECRLLLHLNKVGLPVSIPLPDRTGRVIQILPAPEGDRFGVMFSFAQGEKLHSVPAELHYQIGTLLGNLHTQTKNLSLERVVYTPEVLLSEPMEQIKKFLATDTPEWSFLEEACSEITKELSQADAAQLRWGAVHLDIWYDNMNVGKDGAITLFDFDFCGNGWLALDPAYYILQLHNVEREETERQPKIDAFLRGYESITPLTPEERRLLPTLGLSLYFFYLGVQCRRYDNWSNSFLSESYLKRFINVLVKKYYDLYRIGE